MNAEEQLINVNPYNWPTIIKVDEDNYFLVINNSTQEWNVTSSNTAIATVSKYSDNYVYVSGKKPGKATITVKTKDGKSKDSMEVTVASMTVSPQNITVKIGETKKLTVSFNPQEYGANGVTWENPYNYDCFTINSKGEIKGLKKGYGWIRVSSKKDSNLAGDYYVTVTESIANAKIKVDDCVYTGYAQTPYPTVTLNGQEFSTYYYDYSYKNNINAGTATITIKGKNGYHGSKSATFKIKQASITKDLWGFDYPQIDGVQVYNGKAHKPVIEFRNRETTKNNPNLQVTYKNNINAGTATAVVKGVKNYTGSTTVTFKIEPLELWFANVGSLSNRSYTGSAIKPMPSVTFNGKSLVAGKDYTIKWDDNVNEGWGSATLKGKGNFVGHVYRFFKISNEGTVNVYGKIRRIYGPNRYETSKGIADAFRTDTKQTKLNNVVVACGSNFPDALAASYLAKVKKSPVLVWNQNNNGVIQKYIKNNLKKGGRIYILGGNGVVSNSFEKGMGNYKITRLYDSDRYGTNLKILNTAGISKTEVLVCDGSRFENALIASATGKPMLLVSKKGLSQKQVNWINQNKSKITKFTIIGNTSSVNSDTEKQLKRYKTVARISGNNTDEISAKVAKAYFKKPTEITLAIATAFPDGLCGGSLAIVNNSPIFLVTNKNYSKTQAYCKSLNIKRVTVLGGPKLVTDKTAKAIGKIK